MRELLEQALNHARQTQEHLLGVTREAPLILAVHAPTDSETLQGILLDSRDEQRTPDGFWVGVGSYDALGAAPTDSAPRGTIEQFLQDYPRFRLPPRDRPPKHLAWWVLPNEAKVLLEQGRRRGEYGGIPTKAPYWHIQNVGSAAATIVGNQYVERALADIERLWNRALSL